MQPNKPEKPDAPNVFRQLGSYREQGLCEIYFPIDKEMQMKVCQLIVDELERLGHECKTVEVQGLKFIFMSAEAAKAVKDAVNQPLAVDKRDELEISFKGPSVIRRSGYTRLDYSMEDETQVGEYRQAVAELDFLEVHHFNHKTGANVALFMPDEAASLLDLSDRRSSVAHALNRKPEDEEA